MDSRDRNNYMLVRLSVLRSLKHSDFLFSVLTRVAARFNPLHVASTLIGGQGNGEERESE